MSDRASHVTTDHDTIRKWAEARDGKPATVRDTTDQGEPGIITLDFPGYDGGDDLDAISWDQWFKKFEHNKLALLYQEHTADGQKSNFNKLVSREKAE